MRDWMVTMVAPGCIEKKDWVLRWLRRFEGQIRGLQGIFDGDRYRIEVLDQSSATTRALQAVALELLDDHISHCAGVASFDARLQEGTLGAK
jgi:DNA-binding FrmR family transcriptional regulator